MALSPIKSKWSQQLTTGESTTFVIETTALTNTYAIYRPVFRFHNFDASGENATLEIVYTLTLNSTGDDPLHTGTYTNTVVDTTVPAEGMYTYDFDGIQLDNDTISTVTHTVTITNIGLSTHVFHSFLFGMTEVQTQFPSANTIVRNS